MAAMSRDQWVMVLAGACSGCEVCGGYGRVGRVQRTFKTSGRGVRREKPRPRFRFVKCPGCKTWRWLLEQLGVPVRFEYPPSESMVL